MDLVRGVGWGLEPTLLLDPLGHPPQLRAVAQQPTPPQAESPAKGIINFQLRWAPFPLCNSVLNCKF